MSFTETQMKKLTSLQNRAKSIIHSENVPNITDVFNCESCLLVKKCLEKELYDPIFDEYFIMISHEKRTRNSNSLLRLPHLKVAKESFYFGGTYLN